MFGRKSALSAVRGGWLKIEFFKTISHRSGHRLIIKPDEMNKDILSKWCILVRFCSVTEKTNRDLNVVRLCPSAFCPYNLKLQIRTENPIKRITFLPKSTPDCFM